MPDIAEPPPADAKAKAKADKKDKPPIPRDSAREAVETLVFVVVLVLLLKLFVTEAFVIPTGSMAETLYGYQKIVTCPKCGHEFPVNSHDEVEGRDGKRTMLVGYCCPNCRHKGRIEDLKPIPPNNTGDRVLVLKPLYHIKEPQRGDVVVFKYPEKPQDKYTAQNYIKRAMGFGGETIGIYRGDLFVTRSLDYPTDKMDEHGHPVYPRPTDPVDLWKPKYMYSTVNDSNPLAADLFDVSRGAGFPAGRGGFEMIRKGESQLLADLRIVWDNDKQPSDLAGKVPPRWYPVNPAAPMGATPTATWTGDNRDQPKVFAHERAELDWVRYRHLAMPWIANPNIVADDSHPPFDLEALAKQSPVPVDNFLGYNAGMSVDPNGQMAPRDSQGMDRMWVGDLCLECKATVAAGTEVVLEVSKGVNRFQAKFEEGKVTLARVGPDNADHPFASPSRPCKVRAGGTHTLRFANIDTRLWVWVDGSHIDFGTDGDYLPATPDQESAFKDSEGRPDIDPQGWTRTNDVDAPASIGAKGKTTVSSIKLHRDIYYTRRDKDPVRGSLYYVQPGHYMCMGDNSAHSSDSRDWGTVPQRLMLGKAVFVFWPGWPNNRIGFIK